jgi:hypothetical protein
MNNIKIRNKKYLLVSMLITLATISSMKASEAAQYRDTQEVGLYQIEPIDNKADPDWLWIMNTKTGQVRVCKHQGFDEPPRCGPWSRI